MPGPRDIFPIEAGARRLREAAEARRAAEALPAGPDRDRAAAAAQEQESKALSAMNVLVDEDAVLDLVAELQAWRTAADLGRPRDGHYNLAWRDALHFVEMEGELSGRVRALADVAAERRRQMAAEGWTLEHDDQHADGELAKAAACYAATGAVPPGKLPPAAHDMMTRTWPWSCEWWKPRGGRADLVRAAALLVAEIERLDRLAAREAANAD